MRVRLENELYKQLALSIHTTNEKMDQLSPKREDAASKIVDGILHGAKNVPIIKNLVYKSSEFKTEEEKKKDESIKQGAIVGIKNEGDGWKVIKVEGDKVTVEKESKATKNVKEKDLMTWNGINEKGKFKKGDKVRVIRRDGQIDVDWTIGEITSGKITVSKENVKTQKTVKKKNVVAAEKTADMEGIKELAKELNGLKDHELNLANIRANLKDIASFDSASKILHDKLKQLSQNRSYFEGLDDKTANDIDNSFNIDVVRYNETIKDKATKEKMIDREKDKKTFDKRVERDKNLIKKLPVEFKDFKDSFLAYMEYLSKTYHETKYSDETEENGSEKDEEKEMDELLKKVFNANEIDTIAKGDNAKEILGSIEKTKDQLKPMIKNHPAAETYFQALDRVTSDAKTNKRIKGYSREKLKDDVEKAENEHAKKYLKAVLKKMEHLIKIGEDGIENKNKGSARTKSKNTKKK